MLQTLVTDMKRIVKEITSPFSYIHDMIVEAIGHVHDELVALKERVSVLEARVKELEAHTDFVPPPSQVREPEPESTHPVEGSGQLSDSPSHDDHGEPHGHSDSPGLDGHPDHLHPGN